MTWLKKLFHQHTYIPTSRRLIGHGKHIENTGVSVDVDTTNIYIIKSYCLECKKKFEAKQEVIACLDYKQPYDVAEDN